MNEVERIRFTRLFILGAQDLLRGEKGIPMTDQTAFVEAIAEARASGNPFVKRNWPSKKMMTGIRIRRMMDLAIAAGFAAREKGSAVVRATTTDKEMRACRLAEPDYWSVRAITRSYLRKKGLLPPGDPKTDRLHDEGDPMMAELDSPAVRDRIEAETRASIQRRFPGVRRMYHSRPIRSAG